MSKKPKENRRNFLRQFRDEKSNELRQLTANQFMEIWQHYDLNSNGYLEGNELDMFLRELCTSVGNVDSEASKNVIPESIFNEFKEDILEAYDEDGDGRISVHELAEILPTEENFLLCFRLDNFLDSGDFMKIWIEFDKDGSGYIEINELKEFVSKLLENNKNKQTIISEEKLNEYTESILKIFDSNEDGRLQLSEMIKLLDERENQSLKKILGKCSTITNEDLDEIMMAYNMNTSDEIEGEELNKLAKDLLEITHQEYTVEDLRIFKNGLLSAADLNNDGKISKAEFKIVLMALSSKK